MLKLTDTKKRNVKIMVRKLINLLLYCCVSSLIEVGNSSDPFPTEETQEEIQYLEILQERLQLLRTEVSETLTRDIRTSRKFFQTKNLYYIEMHVRSWRSKYPCQCARCTVAYKETAPVKDHCSI